MQGQDNKVRPPQSTLKDAYGRIVSNFFPGGGGFQCKHGMVAGSPKPPVKMLHACGYFKCAQDFKKMGVSRPLQFCERLNGCTFFSEKSGSKYFYSGIPPLIPSSQSAAQKKVCIKEDLIYGKSTTVTTTRTTTTATTTTSIEYGPNLGNAAVNGALNGLRTVSKSFDNIVTKGDLKKVVEKLEHTFEDQLHEAGKHIMEEQKYLKKVSSTIATILKSGASRRRRRRRRRNKSKALVQWDNDNNNDNSDNNDNDDNNNDNNDDNNKDNDDDNDNNNDNDNEKSDPVQELKKISESIKGKLDDVATNGDLKVVVEKVEHFFEEQLHAAGKHIIENRKYIKRINDDLAAILKSRR